MFLTLSLLGSGAAPGPEFGLLPALLNEFNADVRPFITFDIPGPSDLGGGLGLFDGRFIRSHLAEHSS